MRGVRWNSLSRFAALAVCGTMIVCGCATHKKRGHAETAEAPGPAPMRVGTVAVVNEDLHFVLVDVGTLYMPPAGTALKSFTSGVESGILAVDPEKSGPFIVADVVKGDPKVGDVVEE